MYSIAQLSSFSKNGKLLVTAKDNILSKRCVVLVMVSRLEGRFYRQLEGVCESLAVAQYDARLASARVDHDILESESHAFSYAEMRGGGEVNAIEFRFNRNSNMCASKVFKLRIDSHLSTPLVHPFKFTLKLCRHRLILLQTVCSTVPSC